MRLLIRKLNFDRNVDETLEFISQLTDELEFVYMSETLVKIASKERNDTIIKAYEKITEKFPNIETIQY